MVHMLPAHRLIDCSEYLTHTPIPLRAFKLGLSGKYPSLSSPDLGRVSVMHLPPVFPDWAGDLI